MKCLFLALAFSGVVVGGTYSYHPSTTLHLGAGFHPAFPEKAFRSCLEYDGVDHVDGSGTLKSEYSLNLVKSKKELFDRLGISSSLSARGLFWGASTGVDYFSEHHFHSDSITWMFMAKSDYGRSILKNPRLLPFAQSLKDQGLSREFAEHCGIEFIKQERRSVMIAAVFSLENVSQQDIKRLETYFQASASFGNIDISTNVKYNRFVSEASRISKINLSIHAVGGSGITELSDLVLHHDDLSAIQKSLESYMKTLKESHAVPVEYVSGSMTSFGWQGQPAMEATNRERVLGNLYHQFTKTQKVLERLHSILEDPKYEDDLKYYTAQQKHHQQHLHNLEDAADRCRTSESSCQLPIATPETILWPVNRPASCSQLRFDALESNLLDSNELAKLKELHLAPITNSEHNQIRAYISCEH